jgi:four helix bundle protein
MASYLRLNDISAYKLSFVLSNYVWEIVSKWNYFSQRTVGLQFVNAVDSISANVAEGFGRYSKKDKIKFYYYSLGSAKESLDWNQKARARKLVTEKQHKHIPLELNKLPKEIYFLIRFTNEKLAV